MKFKKLFEKEKREAIKDNIDVIFAAITIISFVGSRIQKRREDEEGEAEQTTYCSAA